MPMNKKILICTGGTGGHVIPAINFGNFLIDNGYICSVILDKRGVKYSKDFKGDIHIINGSVEIAPNIGLADAVCDIVSSGSTLFKNNLKEFTTVLSSEAVLVQSPNLASEKLKLISQIKFRIQSVLRAKKSKYILLNTPNDKIQAISSILPVLKSPTILPLAKAGWSSLHSVISAESFWEVIDQLKDAGAEDILVCPIEKMVL